MPSEEQIPPRRYNSKIDVWLLAVLGGAFILTLMSVFSIVFSRTITRDWWIVVLTLLIWGGVLSLLHPLYYEITTTTLLVRSGWIRRSIPLASIQRVFPTHNPLSSPALSLDRLQIEYRQNGSFQFVLISPQDKASFLSDLANQASHLEMQGDQLVRR